MNSIITELKNLITRFVNRIDEMRAVVEQEKANPKYSLFIQRERERLLREAEQIFQKVTAKDREQTLGVLHDIIDTARTFVSNSILEVDPRTIEKLETIFKVLGDNPPKYIVNSFIDNAIGDFWGLTCIYNHTKDDLGNSPYFPTAPNPEHYIMVLDEIESSCERFIKSYVGDVPLIEQSDKIESVNSTLFLSALTWERWAEALNINEKYITEFSLTSPGLTNSEKEWLATKMGAAARSTEAAKKAKVAEILETSGKHARSILMRSPYVHFVREIENEMLNEDIINITRLTAFEGAAKKLY